jgi:hypothetical protein
MIMLVLAVFVVALASCVLACYSADGDCADDHSSQCVCVCQELVASPDMATATQPVLNPEELVAGSAPLKLRLIAASIFNPPKA